MIKKVLIANRGEIAVRIIRSLKELGIKTVSVYSNCDKYGLWVKLSDESVCIGGNQSKDSYLLTSNLITAALKTHCDAIHPGVGFLSENSNFAKAVSDSGLIFIGPNHKTMALLANKVEARKKAKSAGFEITPGTVETIIDLDDAKKQANKIGYPIMIKACLGGGGKGIKIVETEDDLEQKYAIAKSEALSFFNNDSIHIEKYLPNPRHIEIQLLSNGKDCAFLGERDCSIQRNHQKLLEESPSNVVNDRLRNKLKKAGTKLFKSIKYKGAGTIEFLIQDNHCYFMEVNARVQVEHPVSELISNVDIINETIKIAEDNSTICSNSNITLIGHALEVRINALTCGIINSFTPCIGPKVRVDTHIYSGYEVTPFYDSMLAKVIVHTDSRINSINTMLRALKEIEILGINTNIPQSIAILNDNNFRKGNFDTSFIKEFDKEK